MVCAADIRGDKARQSLLWRLALHGRTYQEIRRRFAARAHASPLTGLVNRLEFLDLLRRAVGRRTTADRPATVVFLDVDGMNAVNDRAGHTVGDKVLRGIAARLAAAVRPSDVAARLGGDEFAVLCEDLGGAEEADEVGRRLGHALRHVVLVGETPVPVTASVGVAVRVAQDDRSVELLARADAAM